MLTVPALSAMPALIFIDESFIEGFGDVPKLEGISEIKDEKIVFDTPAGTYAEAFFIISATKGVLIKQYREALSALGWKEKPLPKAIDGSYTFYKDHEMLALTFYKRGEEPHLRILLTPN